MNPRILRPTRPVGGPEGWRRFLGDPEKHWRKGYSAMACAYAWENADGMPMEIAALMPEGAELILGMPEYKVAVPGRGGDSQCDVFALVRSGSDLIALSVEAKVNESFDKTVGDWLAAGGENRRLRLEALAEIVGVPGEVPGDLRYQLFHRTAAAVLEARRFGAEEAAMVVQSFSPEARWKEDFEAFAGHLNGHRERGGFLSDLSEGPRLFLGWASSDMPVEAAP